MSSTTPVLPPRPLQLDPAFDQRQRKRMALMFGGALALFTVVGIWPGRGAYELWADQRAWDRGAPVELTLVDPSVTVIQGVVRHVRIDIHFMDPSGEELAAQDDYYTLFTDAVGDERPRARFDATSGRVALNWSMDAVGWRWAWLAFIGGVFGLLAALIGREGLKTLQSVRTTHAVSASSDEVWLEVVFNRPPGAERSGDHGTLSYRLPAVTRDEASTYRDAAKPDEGRVVVMSVAPEDVPPLLSPNGTKVLALQARPGKPRFMVVREDLGPFVLTAEQVEDARRVLAGLSASGAAGAEGEP